MSSPEIHAAAVQTPYPSGAQPPSSAPAGNHGGLAAFVAELRASFIAQQTQQTPPADPSQTLHVQGPPEVVIFAVDGADIIDFDQDVILTDGHQDDSLLVMPVGEIEIIQGTFEEVAYDEGAVNEADLDSDDSSDGGDTEEMDWEDDDAEDTLGGDNSFWA